MKILELLCSRCCCPANIRQLISCQSQSYVTTDGLSASLSWNKAPICGLRPDVHYCQTIAGLLIWDALSDERTGLFLQRTIYNVIRVSVRPLCYPINRCKRSKNPQIISRATLTRHNIFTFYMLLHECIYNLYKASVNSGSVQQIMPYH
jgi:hypothetical protein